MYQNSGETAPDTYTSVHRSARRRIRRNKKRRRRKENKGGAGVKISYFCFQSGLPDRTGSECPLLYVAVAVDNLTGCAVLYCRNILLGEERGGGAYIKVTMSAMSGMYCGVLWRFPFLFPLFIVLSISVIIAPFLRMPAITDTGA